VESGDWAAVRRIAAGAGPEASVAVAARVVGTGRRWELSGDLAFPAASTIKAAILVALYREVDAGQLSLDAEVAVEPAAKVPGSGVLTWMRDGLRLTVADLAYLMIAISDNTASNLLLDLVGMDRVRTTIADLGLSGTALNRRFLGRAPGPDEPDNWTKAADLAALFEAIATDRAATPESCAAMRATLALQQHRDRIPRLLPETFDYAGKTGSLPALTHDAGLVSTSHGTLVLAVLTRGIADPWAADGLIGRIARAAVAAATA
jgi:beta-lactamase class A